MERQVSRRAADHCLMQITIFSKRRQLRSGGLPLLIIQLVPADNDRRRDLDFTDTNTRGPITLEHLLLILKHHHSMADVMTDLQVTSGALGVRSL